MLHEFSSLLLRVCIYSVAFFGLYIQHAALFHTSHSFFFVASHSAYTEAYNVCALAAGPQVNPVGEDVRKTMGEEDQGRTSEEDEAVTENNYDRQVGFLTGTLRGEKRFYR